MDYKRVLVKISGEALAGEQKTGIDFKIARAVCSKIRDCVDMGIQIAIVVGAGNFWRGRNNDNNLDATRADHMGMLATMMNALALQDTLINFGVDTRVLAAVDMQQFAEPYIRDKAVAHLNNGKVVIFGCGTGNPFFTTDTAAALRAVEIGADIVMLAKNVDGIYSDDPNKNPNATKFDKISYMDVLAKELSVIDTTATALCKDNNMPILLFHLDKDGENIKKALTGDKIVGTIVMN